jgi:hypothetical protein
MLIITQILNHVGVDLKINKKIIFYQKYKIFGLSQRILLLQKEDIYAEYF